MLRRTGRWTSVGKKGRDVSQWIALMDIHGQHDFIVTSHLPRLLTHGDAFFANSLMTCLFLNVSFLFVLLIPEQIGTNTNLLKNRAMKQNL